MVRSLVGCLLVVGLVSAGCGGSSAPTGDAVSSAPAAALAPAPSTEPASVADLFPQGPGRDLVLNTCSACHSVACSTIGQRTSERWASLKDAHRDKLQNTSPADLDAIFGYLAANFNDTKPEPRVPARFLEGGCTPF